MEEMELFSLIFLAQRLQLCIIENTDRSKAMKKLVLILSLVVIIAVFLSSCASIETRYTGIRIPADPAEYEYRDYGPQGYYPNDYYYDPYYTSGFSPTFWGGFGFWNPFWYYGFLGSYYYASPYYWGYYPYSSYWGRGYYSPYGGSGYYPNRSTYRTYIRKNQISKGRSNRSPAVRTKSSVKRSGSRTGIRSRSLTPTRTRTSATRTRTSSRTAVKKK